MMVFFSIPGACVVGGAGVEGIRVDVRSGSVNPFAKGRPDIGEEQVSLGDRCAKAPMTATGIFPALKKGLRGISNSTKDNEREASNGT
jgi:hypothetical protein